MNALIIVSSLLAATCIHTVNSQINKIIPLEPNVQPPLESDLISQVLPARTPLGYYLPSGVELVVGDYRSTFKCEGRIYGYYADQDNNCQIFHVCIPFVDDQGTDVPTMYSFFCGNQTVFDQSHLVCAHPADALPCAEAHNFYSVNDNFGRTDVPFLKK